MSDAEVVCAAYKKARRSDPNFGDQATENILCDFVAEVLGTRDLLDFVKTEEFAKAFWRDALIPPENHLKYFENARNPFKYLENFL